MKPNAGKRPSAKVQNHYSAATPGKILEHGPCIVLRLLYTVFLVTSTIRILDHASGITATELPVCLSQLGRSRSSRPPILKPPMFKTARPLPSISSLLPHSARCQTQQAESTALEQDTALDERCTDVKLRQNRGKKGTRAPRKHTWSRSVHGLPPGRRWWKSSGSMEGGGSWKVGMRDGLALWGDWHPGEDTLLLPRESLVCRRRSRTRLASWKRDKSGLKTDCPPAHC